MIRFVTGTDTGVGKTMVTAWLAQQALRAGKTVAVYKPVQTGSSAENIPEDPCTLMGYLGGQVSCWSEVPQIIEQPLAVGYTYNFLPPVTPAVADEMGCIDVNRVVGIAQALAQQADVLLIEGAGGLMVPLTNQMDMLNLIQLLYQAIPQMCCTVVARPNLGTINHTRLTLAALQGIPVDRVVVSGYVAESCDVAIASLPRMFAQWLPMPVTYLPPLPNHSAHWPSDHWAEPPAV